MRIKETHTKRCLISGMKNSRLSTFWWRLQELPSALISMQNDNNTTYNTYLQVQNELQSAVNELRDELALAKFGMTYRQLEEIYGRNKQDKKTLEKITAVRSVYLSVFLRLNHVTQAQTTTDMGKFKRRQAPYGCYFYSITADIVFMLLFFMVATVLRTEEEKVQGRCPEVSELIKSKRNTYPLHQHWCTNGYCRGTEPVIQLNDQFSSVVEIQDWISKERLTLAEAEQSKMWVSLKVDQETKMGIVSNVKQELRKVSSKGTTQQTVT